MPMAGLDREVHPLRVPEDYKGVVRTQILVFDRSFITSFDVAFL